MTADFAERLRRGHQLIGTLVGLNNTDVVELQAAGIQLGISGLSPEAVHPYRDRHFSLIAVDVDSLFLGQATAGVLEALRHE